MAMMMILALTLTLNMIFQKFWIIYNEDLIHMNSYLIAPSNISSLFISRFDIYTLQKARDESELIDKILAFILYATLFVCALFIVPVGKYAGMM